MPSHVTLLPSYLGLNFKNSSLFFRTLSRLRLVCTASDQLQILSTRMRKAFRKLEIGREFVPSSIACIESSNYIDQESGFTIAWGSRDIIKNEEDLFLVQFVAEKKIFSPNEESRLNFKCNSIQFIRRHQLYFTANSQIERTISKSQN